MAYLYMPGNGQYSSLWVSGRRWDGFVLDAKEESHSESPGNPLDHCFRVCLTGEWGVEGVISRNCSHLLCSPLNSPTRLVCGNLLSATVMKAMTKNSSGRKGCVTAHSLQSVAKSEDRVGSQGRSLEAPIHAEHTKVLTGLLSLTTQNHLPRATPSSISH